MPHYSNINTNLVSPTLTQSTSNSNTRFHSDPNSINSNSDNVFAAMLGVLPPPPERDSESILTIDRPVLSTEEEQEKWLAESLEIVNTKHRMMLEQMKTPASFRYVETSSNNTICTIEEYGTSIYSVLRIGAEIFAELRTSALPPHLYYELYMRIFDCTHELYVYLEDELIHKNINTTNTNGNNQNEENHLLTKQAKRPTLEEVYEKVQYVGSIVPRLYLLIIIGSLYISYGQSKLNVNDSNKYDKDDLTLEILQDLLEMCKGVQHPTRGLFLRHFLLTMMKNKLPGDVPLASSLMENTNVTSTYSDKVNNVHIAEINPEKPSVQTTDDRNENTSEEVSQQIKEANWENEGGQNAPSEESVSNTNNIPTTSTINKDNNNTPIEKEEEEIKENYQQAVLRTANLLIQNLREMNWLWIRMEAPRHNYYKNNNSGDNSGFGAATSIRRSTPQQQSTSNNHNRVNSKTSSVETNSLPLSVSRKTYKERSELKVLVGMNIVRISQLDGIDVEIYKRHILPKLLTVIVKHREPLAQQYLFEVIIQVFPDEFHLESLHLLLDALFTLTIDVDVGEVLRVLMDRLGKYVCDVRDGLIESNLSLSTKMSHHNEQKKNNIPLKDAAATNTNINKKEDDGEVNEYPSTDITHTPHNDVVEYLFTVFLTSLQSVNILYDLKSIYGNVASTHGSGTTDAKNKTVNTNTAADGTNTMITTPSIDRSVRRSASIPPRTPIPFGAYVNTMASLALLVVKLTAKPTLQSNKHHLNDNNNNKVELSTAINKNEEQQLMQTRITYFTQILQCVLNKYKMASPTPIATSTSSSSDANKINNSSSNPRNNQLAVRATVKLMSHVMEYTSTLPAVLSIHPFIELHRYLPFLERRRMAVEICETLTSCKPVKKYTVTTTSTNNTNNNVPEEQEQQSIKRKVRLTSHNIHALLSLMQPLTEDVADAPGDAKIIYTYDAEHGFMDEQILMCKVMHVIMNNSLVSEAALSKYVSHVYPTNHINENKSIKQNMKKMVLLMNNITLMFNVEDAIRRGGARRIKYTFPTLISIYLETAAKLITFITHVNSISETQSTDVMGKEKGNEQDEELKKDAQHLLMELYHRLFRYSSYCVTHINEVNNTHGLLNTFAATYPIESFYYLLQAAEVAIRSTHTQEKSFDCLVESCTIYEMYASERRVQMDMLHCLINALIHRSKKIQQISGSSNTNNNLNLLQWQQNNKLNEEQEKLTFRVIQYCGKILHKADHARLLIQCAHMFTTPPSSGSNNDTTNNNKMNVNECVERALAIASQISEQPLLQLAVHVDLLNLMLPLYTLKNNYALGEVRLINFVIDKIGELKQKYKVEEHETGETVETATEKSTSEMESKSKKNVSSTKNAHSRDKSNTTNTTAEDPSSLTTGTHLNSKAVISGCEDALSTSTSHTPIT